MQRHWSDDPAEEMSYEIHGQLFGGFTGQVIRAFADLRVADLLDTGPASVPQLCRAIGADENALSSFLSVCVSLNLVQADEDGLLAVTDRGRLLASDAFDAKLARFLASPGANRRFEQIADLVRTREPADSPADAGIYPYLAEDSAAQAAFVDLMGEFSAGCAPDLLSCYDFSRHDRIVDVGGGNGTLLSHILRAAPQATGVLYEQPGVLDLARSSVDPRIAERIEFTAGNFLDKVPPDGDLYLLKSVLCDWDDREAGQILANCHQAAPPGSTLLVVDWSCPARPPAGISTDETVFRNLFLRSIFGGRLRSLYEFRTIVTEAGFDLTQVLPEFSTGSSFGPPSPWNLIVARR
ncbi:methyltransferase [Amycolatopsis sp. NPDC054798]